MHAPLFVSDPTVYTNSFYGDGDGPIFYSQMDCKGPETSIIQCDKKEFGSFECARSNVVGIACRNSEFQRCLIAFTYVIDCGGDGTVRLVGGSNDYEGTIEVCFESLWGLVTADAYWDDTDAQIVCKQLNYTGGIPIVNFIL